jgi:hypothetical protein
MKSEQAIGIIMDAEAMSETDTVIALDLMFADSLEGFENNEITCKRFYMKHTDAQDLANRLAVILSAPNAMAARERIAAGIAEDGLFAEGWAELEVEEPTEDWSKKEALRRGPGLLVFTRNLCDLSSSPSFAATGFNELRSLLLMKSEGLPKLCMLLHWRSDDHSQRQFCST